MMTVIDRTIYRWMKRSYTTKELVEDFTSKDEDHHFVNTMTRTVQDQFNFMLWFRLFPCPGYFPVLGEISDPLVDQFRKLLDFAIEVVSGYDHDRTLYRHH